MPQPQSSMDKINAEQENATGSANNAGSTPVNENQQPDSQSPQAPQQPEQLAALIQAMTLQTQTLNAMAARIQQLEETVAQQAQQQNQQHRAGLEMHQMNMPQNMEVEDEQESELMTDNPNICHQLNLKSATELIKIQIQNPRLNLRTKTYAFDTLQMHDSLDDEARSNPTVQGLLKKQIAVSAGNMVGGPRYGTWIADSITADAIGLPRPKQPEYQVPSYNPRKSGRRGGQNSNRHGGGVRRGK